MNVQFDEIIDRRNTNSLKYDFACERGRSPHLLPMWVADMDFRTVPEVNEKLRQCADHGIYGYSETDSGYFGAVSGWYERYFGWKTREEWLVKTPGVVFAIAAAVRALTEPGEAVLIQSPVYYPFREVVLANGRRVAANSLVNRDGHYEIDFEDFEKKIRETKVRLFILCSPHNPVGRVWTKEELLEMGRVCFKYGVKVVSDEIHSDFARPGHPHTVFASLGGEYQEHSVICTSPSKTFNLAGLQVSNIFIPQGDIRRKVKKAIRQTGYSQLNLFGIAACRTAYESGREWLDSLKSYLEGNIRYVQEYLKDNIPQVKLTEPEGLYLLWLDFRKLGLGGRELDRVIEDRAGLWLDGGTMFGPEGEGFQRMNIACPRKTVEQAMESLGSLVDCQPKQGG